MIHHLRCRGTRSCVSSGSKYKELNVSKSSPLRPNEQTSKRRAVNGPITDMTTQVAFAILWYRGLHFPLATSVRHAPPSASALVDLTKACAARCWIAKARIRHFRASTHCLRAWLDCCERERQLRVSAFRGAFWVSPSS